MAIPTTQKECTTRRIAALIIGLWDKIKNAFLLKTSRGAANGVASLDANGKVPSSQLPSFGYGTVTSVATGVGLRGGTITDSGTISVNVPRNPSSNVNSPFPSSTTINTMEMQEYNGTTQSNCPSSTDWWHILSTVGSDGAYKTQLAQKMSDKVVPNLCVRVLQNNSWGSWFSTRDASWILTGKISSDRLPSNSSSSAGIVASGSGQSAKAWMTDVNGNPAWRNVIEHVTTIPVNPTVGTIYAL